jgi:hypothetical protein
MAKILLELDTDSKAMSVNVDGSELKNVQSFQVYEDINYDGERRLGLNICTQSKNDDGTIRHLHYITMAKEGGLVKSTKEPDAAAKKIAANLSSFASNILK